MLRKAVRESTSVRPTLTSFVKTRAQSFPNGGCTTKKHLSTNSESVSMSTDWCDMMCKAASMYIVGKVPHGKKIARMAWTHSSPESYFEHGTERLISGDRTTLSMCSTQSVGAVNILSTIVSPDEDGNCSTLCRPAAFIRSSSIEIIALVCASRIRARGLSRAARSLRI